jgi:hypothetical protein
MANKTNTSNQTFTRPQGRGALPGIGEIFSPHVHTCMGNFTLPMPLPPGRNEFQDQPRGILWQTNTPR